MKTKYITILLLLLLIVSSKGQQLNRNKASDLDPNIKSLKIGDRVPDILFSKVINNETRTARIADFKNQLLILDFWDTSCGACIKTMPKLSALQRKFGNNIKILAVTWQKEIDVTQFFKTNRFLNEQKPPVRLPCVVEDKLLNSYFKHYYVPHTVWIYKGVVKAITLPEYFNAENIQTILDGKEVNWPIKNDFFDKRKSLISLNDSDQYFNNSKFFSYSVLTGQKKGLSKPVGWDFSFDSLKHIYKVTLFNQSIVEAYKILLFNSDSLRKEFVLTPGRVFLRVKDPSNYVYNSERHRKDLWDSENQICYEIATSNTVTEKKMAKMALKDLDNKLGLYVRWEKRKTQCLVIVKINAKSTSDTILQKEGLSIPFIILFKLDQTGKFPPAIDETGFKGKITLDPDDGTLQGLRKELQKHGFDIIEAEREIDVMMITEINK